MIIFVEPHERAMHTAVLNQYFSLRKKIFCDQLRWVPPTTGDIERDDFDNEFNVYVLHVEDDTGKLTGGVRLMPTTGPTLMHTVWADMLPDKDDFRSPTIWEATRFCVDPNTSSRRSSLANKATLSLTLAVIDFAQTNGISHIIAVCESKFFDMTNAYSGEAEILHRKIDANGVDICCGLWAANADRSRLAWARQLIGASPPEVVLKVA